MAGEAAFTASEEEYAAANREWYRCFMRRRWPRLFLSAIGTGAALGTIIGVLDHGWDPVAIFASAVPPSLIGLVVPPAMYGFCRLTIPRRARTLYRQHKTLQRPLRFAWSDEGLGYTTSTGTGSLAWRDLHRWAEGRGNFLFFVTDAMFYFIPKRVLSEAEADDLRTVAGGSGLQRL